MSRSWLLASLVLLAFGIRAAAEWDIKSDNWVARDALGRSLPGYGECGPPRAGKYVGIFYFLWLGQHGTDGPYDITKILAANPTDPAWGPVSAFHHWGESELGYYLSDDDYVIRKHCQLFVDAGIDVIIFDATNGFPYTSNYMLVLSIYQQIRNEGGRTPQVAFLVNPFTNSLVNTLYTDLYSKNLYPDLWFKWKDKPLMLTIPDGLSTDIQSFFTFRQCWAWSRSWWWGTGQDKWTWLDHFPQEAGWHTPGVPEELSVCVAQHPTTNIGRSFHGGAQPPESEWRTDEGPCFAEQWSRVLEPPVDPEAEIDPEFVFITGWNEWVAQRFLSDGDDWFLGSQLPAGETYFVDEYTQEYSRDIEPMKSGHTDNYFYQMVSYVRRYKGVPAPDLPSAAKTITIDGVFTDWDDVAPEYRDHSGDTTHRNHAGWGSAGTYVNTTGRNDIVVSKVARDINNIYFYVQTAANLTSRALPNWMLLFIDSDCDKTTGWQGYDYLINYPPVNSTTTTLKRSTDGWNWTLVRNMSYRYSGNRMEIRVPRADIDQSDSRIAFDFHWSDNIQKTDDIIEFSVSGDSAPDRRFDYHFDTGTQVLDVDSTRPDGYCKTGEIVNVQVRFQDPVFVSGSPKLELETGDVNRLATCTSGGGTDTLNFIYVVQAGDISPDLDYTSTGALTLNGGSIIDFYGTPASLDLPAPGASGSLGYNRNLIVDGVRPFVVGVTSPVVNGVYAPGEQIPIHISFSEPVSVTSSPRLDLETGSVNRSADYASGSGTSLLAFTYTVSPGDCAADLDYVSTTALVADDASIKDAAGNYANRTLALPGSPGSLGQAKDLVIIPSDGSIGLAKQQAVGSSVALGGKIVYLKQEGFVYIEEPTRASGIRVEGNLAGDEGQYVCLTGTIGNTTGGERCILSTVVTPKGAGFASPLGASGSSLVSPLVDGLYVRIWGRVVPGSVTGNSFVLSDGGSIAGIAVLTPGVPGVSDGDFVVVEGAAGYSGGRVVYAKQ